jgi:hypothetical protein
MKLPSFAEVLQRVPFGNAHSRSNREPFTVWSHGTQTSPQAGLNVRLAPGSLRHRASGFGRLLTDWLLIPVDPMETLGTGGYRELPRSPRRIFGTPIPPEIPPRLIGYHWILMDVSGHAMP